MKITKSQIKQIIEEEFKNVLEDLVSMLTGRERYEMKVNEWDPSVPEDIEAYREWKAQKEKTGNPFAHHLTPKYTRRHPRRRGDD